VILRLALRHLVVRPWRALVLLAGYGVGVGVMIVLLAVGEAMLLQSRDVALVGGGEVTVLPQGIDIEALRTGAVSAHFHGVDRARFVQRQQLAGPRQAGLVRTAAPVIERKLLYLDIGGRIVPVRAGGEIPSRSRAAGAALAVIEGRWEDTPADSAWFAPTSQQLYDELGRFHLPAVGDPAWAEWHYFNLVTAPGEWWYITYLVGGDIPGGNWGGRLLVTHRRPDGVHDEYTAEVPSAAVAFGTARADLTLGASSVRQRAGTYHLTGVARRADGRRLTFRLAVTPAPHRWFPPVEISDPPFVSGYVVPAVRAEAEGRICLGGACRAVTAPAYHDHNWGVWREVTWEWGMGRGDQLDLVYGGVHPPGDPQGTSPFFFAVVDSLGVLQVLRIREIGFEDERPLAAFPGVTGPGRLRILASRGADSVVVGVVVTDQHATRREPGAPVFLQLRGRWVLEGRVTGQPVRDEGEGFFETWRGGEREDARREK
jgi:hypothetical protein